MRITNNMLVDNMVYNLNGNLQRLEELQYQMATGKKFRVPSDDPIGVSKSLKFNTDLSKVNQYVRNTKDAYSWMKETESALSEINAVLHRANELTVQAATGTNSPEDLEKIKEEIKELKGHLIQVGNSTYAGRHLFTGFKTDKPLLDEEGNYNIDLRPDEIFEYNVGVSETALINTLGGKVFGSPSGGYGGEVKTGEKPTLIKVFEDLSEALENNVTADIQKSIGNIKSSMEQVLSVRAEVGAKSNRLELTQNKLEYQVISLKELLSFNEDVSLPEAYMKLNIEENVYRSSLAVGGRIIQPSLMDFLR
ncbi:flagellar hook-associated protein FlgL [Tissierella sp. MSJ-40]|uniref:Flagellar hook-associated protein FlgL n=1 Tax=Tissierella simiarum TaxID=2841534 RepID=A0ABS6E1F2_9FIRM|nr:flagellar hook-associated protein FlgL [Tissierella simiarum]MBU5436676.1 flagellar hook-associated protein FlgL [Tissierella simiarum]